MTLEEYTLPGERWKDIDGYEGRYAVSDYGRTWNYRTGAPIAISKCAPYRIVNGKKCYYRDATRQYYAVQLYKNGTGRHIRVHRLVAFAFLDNDDPEHKTVVDHIDNDPMNNMAINLRWASPKGNYDNSKSEEQTYTRWLIKRLAAINDNKERTEGEPE